YRLHALLTLPRSHAPAFPRSPLQHRRPLQLEELPPDAEEPPLPALAPRPVKVERVGAEEEVVAALDGAAGDGAGHLPRQRADDVAEEVAAGGAPVLAHHVARPPLDERGEVVLARVEEREGARDDEDEEEGLHGRGGRPGQQFRPARRAT